MLLIEIVLANIETYLLGAAAYQQASQAMDTRRDSFRTMEH